MAIDKYLAWLNVRIGQEEENLAHATEVRRKRNINAMLLTLKEARNTYLRCKED